MRSRIFTVLRNAATICFLIDFAFDTNALRVHCATMIVFLACAIPYAINARAAANYRYVLRLFAVLIALVIFLIPPWQPAVVDTHGERSTDLTHYYELGYRFILSPPDIPATVYSDLATFPSVLRIVAQPIQDLVWDELLAVALVYASITFGIRLMKQRIESKREKCGSCVNCGYDLRATEGACPECGAVQSTRTTHLAFDEPDSAQAKEPPLRG